MHDLAALLQDWPQAEYNIEGNPFHNLMGFVRAVRPQQATFVPDSEGQFTSDHGWDLAADGDAAAPADRRVPGAGRARQPVHGRRAGGDGRRRARVGADRVELYTEPYAARARHAAAGRAAGRASPPPRAPRWPPAWASTPATT